MMQTTLCMSSVPDCGSASNVIQNDKPIISSMSRKLTRGSSFYMVNGGSAEENIVSRELLLQQSNLVKDLAIEKYKKIIAYIVVLCIFCMITVFSVIILYIKSGNGESSFEEVRRRMMNLMPGEHIRQCITIYPNSISRKYINSSRSNEKISVGEPLYLTSLIKQGRYEEAANQARVTNVMETEVSYAGYFIVNKLYNSSLFFWFFPAKSGSDETIPVILWLQGGPGWPTMYGIFKQNGPYLIGWNNPNSKLVILSNKFAWNKHFHMLYIDNPVGTGFSFTESDEGFPQSDKAVAIDLIEAISQFMLIYPVMVGSVDSTRIPFYAFGESYGGSYVTSLAHLFLQRRKQDSFYMANVDFKAIGIGNGFIDAETQSLYADFLSTVSYLTPQQMAQFKAFDMATLKAIKKKEYGNANAITQHALSYAVSKVLNLTNLYDYTINNNYLTQHEYVCFLQQEAVRKGIHVGHKAFNRGYQTYAYLNNTIMVSKRKMLLDILDSGNIEVLIYNGNLDVIVNLLGMNRLVNKLVWRDREQFIVSKQKEFWVYNDDERHSELAGYVNEGGRLTYVVVRNAGHMVPISQPRWALEMILQFTKRKGKRFLKPKEMLNQTNKTQQLFYEC